MNDCKPDYKHYDALLLKRSNFLNSYIKRLNGLQAFFLYAIVVFLPLTYGFDVIEKSYNYILLNYASKAVSDGLVTKNVHIVQRIESAICQK